MSDLIPVDYRILAMLQEWVFQQPLRNVDKLRQRLMDRQTIIDHALIDGDLGYGQRWTLALQCWSIRFHTFMMFHLNVGYDNDDVKLT